MKSLVTLLENYVQSTPEVVNQIVTALRKVTY